MNRIRRLVAGVLFGAAIAWLLGAIAGRIRRRLELERALADIELGLAFPNEWGVRTTPLEGRELEAAIALERDAISTAIETRPPGIIVARDLAGDPESSRSNRPAAAWSIAVDESGAIVAPADGLGSRQPAPAVVPNHGGRPA